MNARALPSDGATARAESIARASARLAGRTVGGYGNGPALYYGSAAHGWTAVADVKPTGRRYRIIRGHGRTPVDALGDLARQIERFENGARDGEQ